MNISSNDRELLIKNYYGYKMVDIKSKAIFELVYKAIDDMTDEEAKKILRVSKKYPENNDIDENKLTDVIKVIVRYIGRFCMAFHEFQYSYDGSCGMYEYYNKRIDYYETIIEELNSDTFTYNKLIMMLASEKIFSDYQEFSDCQGLAMINSYIRENIYSIVGSKLRAIVNEDILKRDYYLRCDNKKKRRSRG